MGDNDKCTTQAAVDAGNKVVILAFGLADSTIVNSPDLLAATLKSDKVQEAIKLTLGSFILSRIPTTAGELSEADAMALLKSLQGVATGPISTDLQDKIKKSSQLQGARKQRERFSNHSGLHADGRLGESE